MRENAEARAEPKREGKREDTQSAAISMHHMHVRTAVRLETVRHRSRAVSLHNSFAVLEAAVHRVLTKFSRWAGAAFRLFLRVGAARAARAFLRGLAGRGAAEREQLCERGAEFNVERLRVHGEALEVNAERRVGLDGNVGGQHHEAPARISVLRRAAPHPLCPREGEEVDEVGVVEL